MTSTALVTGASSGIGREAAIALARAGHDVIVGYGHNSDAADATATAIRELGQSAHTAQIVLDQPADIAQTVQELIDRHGTPGVLVNSAGIYQHQLFLDIDLDSWNTMLHTDLTGTFVVAQTIARAMVEKGEGGRIVNVSSVHSRIPITGGAAYCTAKGGLGMLTATMALELGEYGITVNAVGPGEIATPMNTDADDTTTSSERPALSIARRGKPEEVGALVTYLASAAAGYITGQTFVIDGGLELIAADANIVPGASGPVTQVTAERREH